MAGSSIGGAGAVKRAVLVHGYKDVGLRMRHVGARLEARGWEVFSPTLGPSDGSAGLDVLARQLAQSVGERFPDGCPLTVVGFSMGGIIARWFAQELGGMARLRRLVTVSSPHRGSFWALFRNGLGHRHLRPGSDFLCRLNAGIGAFPEGSLVSLWSPLDLMIVPASSSRVDGIPNRLVWMPAHPLMIWHPDAILAICEAVDAPSPEKPEIALALG